MKKIALFGILFFLAGGLHGQVTIEYSVGYGKYSMKDMKHLFSSLKDYWLWGYPGIDFKSDNFPGYITHTVQAGYRWKHHEFGLSSSFYTTGGQLSYADYSGEVMQKLTVNGFREGLYYRIYLSEALDWELKRFTLYTGLSPAWIFGKLKSDGYITIGQETETDSAPLKINTSSFSILPELGALYKITQQVSLHVMAGYEFSLPSKIKDLSDKKADWTGIRFTGGVSFAF